jgi:hypothetical protein
MVMGIAHSHSIVPGGFEVTSYTTRLTPLTSLMMGMADATRTLAELADQLSFSSFVIRLESRLGYF